MHVVHIYKDYAPVFGGIESHIHTLAVGLVKRGVQVSVVVCQPRGHALPQDEVMQGVRVIRLPRDVDIASAAFSWQHASIVRHLAPDIIHMQMPWPPGDVISAMHPSIPLVISYQSDVVRQKYAMMAYAPLLRRTLSHAQRIIATSPAYVQTSPWLKQWYAKVHIIPLGIVPPRMPDLGVMAAWRTRLPFPFLLWVGRMRYYKGLHVAIAALAQLPEEIKLVCERKGASQQILLNQVARAGLTSRVMWLGDCSDSDVAALHALARIFVFPSHLRAEAFGLSLLEALAAGVPAISCEIGTGTSFVNQHRRTGLVVPPANPHALAQAIQQLWYDAPLRAQMSTYARQWVLQNFHADQMIDDVVGVYHDVMHGGLITS